MNFSPIKRRFFIPLCAVWLNAVDSLFMSFFSYLGQLVSNKKEELTAILDHFNIQVLLTFTLHCEVFTLAINWDLVLISLWLLSCSSTTQCPSSTKKWVNSSCIPKTKRINTRYNTAWSLYWEKLIIYSNLCILAFFFLSAMAVFHESHPAGADEEGLHPHQAD